MGIFISTGEVSGDLQGALLIAALKRLDQNLEIVALGGDRMAAAGATLLGNTSQVGSVGLIEALPFIWPTFLLQRRAKEYLRQNPPDVLVLIDYAGPNLSLGSYVRQYLSQVPIVYYIAPQNWVWSPSNSTTKQVVEISDLLLAIFPEEARYFSAHGATVCWVGHPLLDLMASAPTREEARVELGIEPDEVVITLLPASRYQEIKYLLPVICAAAKQIQTKLTKTKLLIPVSLSQYFKKVIDAVNKYEIEATLLRVKTKEAIAAADLAIAKSGTVNLEIALLKVPQVVLYQVNPLTMWVARKILKFSIPFMSPPNLVVMKSIVPEFLQEKATPKNIVAESMELLLNKDRKEQMLVGYEEMRESLGEVGVCDRAAREIFRLAAGHYGKCLEKPPSLSGD